MIKHKVEVDITKKYTHLLHVEWGDTFTKKSFKLIRFLTEEDYPQDQLGELKREYAEMVQKREPEYGIYDILDSLNNEYNDGGFDFFGTVYELKEEDYCD